MKPSLYLVAMLILPLLGSGAVAEDISSLVRDLTTQQNRMVIGDANARASAAHQFDLIEKALDGPEINVSDEKTIRAIIIYLLCGGAPPKDKQKFLSSASKLAPLLNASLLYAEGQDGGVPKELMDLDARKISQNMGGHLALVQAGALIGKNNEHAVALLDLARLLVPGSLVEEAALRREVAILDPVRDVDKIILLSFRYIALYSKSPYAKNFWDTLRRVSLDDLSLARPMKFIALFDKAPPSLKVNYNLEIARRAFIAGKLDTAGEAIERASSVNDTGSVKRVDLYKSLLVSLREDKSDLSHERISAAKLNANETSLVGMISSIVSGLSARDVGHELTNDDTYEMATSIRRAITNADDLLKRANR